MLKTVDTTYGDLWSFPKMGVPQKRLVSDRQSYRRWTIQTLLDISNPHPPNFNVVCTSKAWPRMDKISQTPEDSHGDNKRVNLKFWGPGELMHWMVPPALAVAVNTGSGTVAYNFYSVWLFSRYTSHQASGYQPLLHTVGGQFNPL